MIRNVQKLCLSKFFSDRRKKFRKRKTNFWTLETVLRSENFSLLWHLCFCQRVGENSSTKISAVEKFSKNYAFWKIFMILTEGRPSA